MHFDRVLLQIVSADITTALDTLRKWNITIFDIQYLDDLTVQVAVSRGDAKRIVALLSKCGCKITVVGHRGIYWKCKDLFHRPVLTFGLIIYLFLVLAVPGRVFFVRVEGNTAIPSRQILEAAQSCGISFGAVRRQVRSERVKNALLEKIPELQWAGVNTRGCVAVISVRERQETQVQAKKSFGSIVAAQDAIVRQVTVLKGTQLCTVGQAVKAGQLLVSGYKDYGISVKLTGAEGEIYGQTERKLEAVTPSNGLFRTAMGAVERKYSLIIGKKQINFFKDSGISHPTCVKMYKKTYLVLPGGFVLPIALVTQEIVSYDTAVSQVDDFSFMEEISRSYLMGIMSKGTILQEESRISANASICQFNANYYCYEQIGILKEEELITKND